MPSERLVLAACTVDLARLRVHRGGRTIDLSDLESRLLGYLVERAGTSVPRGELLRQVWGYKESMATRTVDMAVRRLRDKIEGDARRPTHLLAVHGSGYRFEPLGQQHPQTEARRGNLPAPASGFVGRAADLASLDRWYAGGARLVTLLGPGGMGKTRLALHWAWTASPPGGAWLVELAPARSEEEAAARVAVAVGLPGADASHALRSLGEALVVLDNLEQIGDAAARLVGAWLATAPALRLIATSREPVGVEGEARHSVEPLPVGEAVALFLARAGDAGAPTDDRATVEAIATRLEGVPLAIELAAARTPVLSPAELLRRLGRPLDILRTGRKDAPERHVALRATIQWSWDLLQPREPAALVGLSVFRGPFTIAAAEAVLGEGALDLVQALRERSLLRTAQERFAPWLAVSEFVANLPGLGEATAEARERHAAYWASRTEVEPADADDAAAAADHALQSERWDVALRAGVPALALLGRRGPLSLAGALGARLLAIPDLANSDRARVLRHLGAAWAIAGESTRAERAILDAVALSDGTADPVGTAQAWSSLGNHRRQQGRLDDARDAFMCALALLRSASSPGVLADALGDLGNVHTIQGDNERAMDCFEEALALHRAAGRRGREGIVLGNIGVLHRERGRMDEALRCLESALALHRETGNRRSEGIVLGNLAELFADLGRPSDARNTCEKAVAVLRAVGNRHGEGIALGNLGRFLIEEGRTAEGQATLDRAMALLEGAGDRHSVAALDGVRAELEAAAGRADRAQERLARAEAVLREVGDKVELGLLLCRRGHAEVSAGRRREASACLAEARALAQAAGVAPGAELDRALSRLAAALQM